MLADPKFNAREGEALLSEVRATFFRVFNQERPHARSDAEAMRFTVTRLKDGDWGESLETVLTEADRRTYQDFANNIPPEPQPGTEAEAQALWRDVSEILASEMTRTNYDLWVQNAKALGLNNIRTALIVQVANDETVESLSERFSPVIERALYQALGGEEEATAGSLHNLLRVAFVTEAMLSELQSAAPAVKSPYPHAEPAQRLWQESLLHLEGQMTRATFNQWLHDSTAMGVNGDGQTLVIRVKNRYAIEWLEDKLYNVAHRTLVSCLRFDEEGEYSDLGLTPETVDLRFVTSEMLAEDVDG